MLTMGVSLGIYVPILFCSSACFQWDNLLVHSAHMGYYADQHQNNPRVARQLHQHQVQGHVQGLGIGHNQGLPIPPQPNPGKPSGKNFYLMTRDDEPFCGENYHSFITRACTKHFLMFFPVQNMLLVLNFFILFCSEPI